MVNTTVCIYWNASIPKEGKFEWRLSYEGDFYKFSAFSHLSQREANFFDWSSFVAWMLWLVRNGQDRRRDCRAKSYHINSNALPSLLFLRHTSNVRLGEYFGSYGFWHPVFLGGRPTLRTVVLEVKFLFSSETIEVNDDRPMSCTGKTFWHRYYLQ